MIGETGFDVARLFPDPEFRRFSEAAVAALSGGTAAPLREAIALDDTPRRRELAAFAASSQGIAPLLATLSDARSLPSDVAAFLTSERSSSSIRAARLKRTLCETVAVLREAGVEVVALKGAALSNFHYAEPALRPMGDLDLLLREPRDLGRATATLSRAGWRALVDTPRHRVFGWPDERVVRPATEDAENPIRLEIHPSFRLPVLGRVYDATRALVEEAETADLDGLLLAIPAGTALLRHLLFHAAGDFAGGGLRGVQAHDFSLLARRAGPLRPELSSRESGREAAPLLFAADAVDRLFPGSFDGGFLRSLARRVEPRLRARAAALPSLRHTRPPHGWTATLLSLAGGPVPRARFLARTLFPTLGEVKANAAPDASGVALALAWLRVLFGRVSYWRRGRQR